MGLFFLQSCTVEQETHFNKDMSGSTSTVIDLTEIMSMASAFGGESEETDEFMQFIETGEFPDSLSQGLDSVIMLMEDAGMKNFTLEPEKGKGLRMSFDFDDIEVLSGAKLMDVLSQELGDSEEMPEEFMSMMQGTSGFEWDGKWLELDMGAGTYQAMMDEMMNDPEMEGASNEEMQASMDMVMAMFGSSMTYKQTYTFARKVKEVESPFPYTKGKKSVTMEMNLGDVMEVLKEGDPEKSKIRIRLR